MRSWGGPARGPGPSPTRIGAALEGLRLHRTEGETLPTLSEVLDILEEGRPALRLEIKYREDRSRYPGLERETLSALRERGLLERTTLTAFDLEVLREVGALAPGQPMIHLIREQEYQADGRRIGPYAEAAREAGVREIAIRIEHLQEGDREICAAYGVALGVFAAHDIPSIRRAFDLGVSAFTTDRPDLALEVRQRADEEPDPRRVGCGEQAWVRAVWLSNPREGSRGRDGNARWRRNRRSATRWNGIPPAATASARS